MFVSRQFSPCLWSFLLFCLVSGGLRGFGGALRNWGHSPFFRSGEKEGMYVGLCIGG